MSSKKKPSSKGAQAAARVQPLLKVMFEVPKQGKIVSVPFFFDAAKRDIYADFGFEQYRSPSVAGLEQKIKAAIKNGATPDAEWTPMIEASISTKWGRSYPKFLDSGVDFDIERKYYCVRGGRLWECDWDVPASQRNKKGGAVEVGAFANTKFKVLPKSFFKKGQRMTSEYVDGDALLPYTDEIWKRLTAAVAQFKWSAAQLINNFAGGDESFLWKLLQGCATAMASPKQSSKPAAKKPAPAKSIKIDARQPALPLGGSSATINQPAALTTVEQMWKMVDQVIDLPAGDVPAAMLAAAGFPEGSTARKEKSGYFMVNIPKQPGDVEFTVGHVKAVEPAAMQKRIRDRFNGERGAAPKAAQKKGSRTAAGVEALKEQQLLRKKKTNGDHTSREHLIVRYQGKQLTLGHGPLGNYLVEALRKTYPTIQMAFCLKDNRVQLTLQRDAAPLVISAEAFELAINNPPKAPVTDPPPAAALGNGAIAKLHELANAMQRDDMAEIPQLILLAAGYSDRATAELYGDGEIIVRVPKKAPEFTNLQALEKRILDRTPAVEQKQPEEELVGA